MLNKVICNAILVIGCLYVSNDNKLWLYDENYVVDGICNSKINMHHRLPWFDVLEIIFNDLWLLTSWSAISVTIARDSDESFFNLNTK